MTTHPELKTAVAIGPFLLATDEQHRAIKMLADALTDSVRMAGTLGVPGGTLYAALMAHGVDLHLFEAMMDSLVRLGRVRRSGYLYFAAGV